MMFEIFSQKFEEDYAVSSSSLVVNGPGVTPYFIEFLIKFGGGSFQNGLYRVVEASEMGKWQSRVAQAYPKFAARISCFGFDWLGSVFAVDSGRSFEGEPGVIMFEPGTGKALEIPGNILSFHESGLYQFGEAALAIKFYESWRQSGGPVPSYNQCIGYRKPLFLGGKDTVDNLEVSDIDVYWDLMAQLIQKTRGMPEGTRP